MNNIDELKKIKLNLFDMAIGDVIRAIKGGSLMGAFILSFCIIDYLAGIKSRNDNIWYKEIVGTYLQDYNSDYLYAIRCALVHVYGKSNAMEAVNLGGFSFEHKKPETHNKIDIVNGSNVYRLNLSNFLFDVIKASYNFFSDLENEPESNLEAYIGRASNLIKMFDSITGEQISRVTNFGSIDPILSPLDSENVDWCLLENGIYKLCLSK